MHFSLNRTYLNKQKAVIWEAHILTLADIHMIRTGKYIVTSLKPIFYKGFVDDIYNRRKKGIHYIWKLYERLNNYHPNIKLTIEINLNKFLHTEIFENKGATETKLCYCTGRQQSYQFLGIRIFLKCIRGIP